MSSNWVRGVAGASALAAALAALPAVAQDDKGKTTFEVYQDAKKEWRWRYKAANGAIIAAPGEGYKAKADATKAIESLQSNAGTMKVEYFEDGKKEHRWRLKAKNGEIMAVSSEGYKNKSGAENGFELLKKGAKSAKIVDAGVKDK
jgi:uncharacterized protein YegP (UPF0339 family)